MESFCFIEGGNSCQSQLVQIDSNHKIIRCVSKDGLPSENQSGAHFKGRSLSLFLEKVGHGVALPPEVKDIARSAAKECAGLPLAITVPAGSMRGVDDICEWRNALEILTESKVRQDDMELRFFKY